MGNRWTLAAIFARDSINVSRRRATVDKSVTDDAASRPTFGLSAEDLLELFRSGQYEIEGRMPESSNLTLLVTVTGEQPPEDDEPISHRAIYKPGKGERPLVDFPDGLYRREVAMYKLASALGWDVVPPTAIVDGPLGEGSAQAFVDANFEHHYFSLSEAGLGEKDLRQLCVLDFIANNTDRKSGHCLQAQNGRILGIDHGLTFHNQFKLRTVMWEYVGDPLGEEILADIDRLLDSDIAATLGELLTGLEIDAVHTRARALRTAGVFPEDDTGGHRWPWPLV